MFVKPIFSLVSLYIQKLAPPAGRAGPPHGSMPYLGGTQPAPAPAAAPAPAHPYHNTMGHLPQAWARQRPTLPPYNMAPNMVNLKIIIMALYCNTTNSE